VFSSGLKIDSALEPPPEVPAEVLKPPAPPPPERLVPPPAAPAITKKSTTKGSLDAAAEKIPNADRAI
jgi:hypothetical protein